MPRLPLTPRQVELIEVIRRHIRDHGYPPTQAEAAARMGIRAGVLGRMLKSIWAKGYLDRRPGVARGFTPKDGD
jgi:repressor LexA